MTIFRFLAVVFVLVPFLSGGSARAAGTSEGSTAHRFDGKDLIVHRWSEIHGLPSSSVLAIARTRDGYLWLGTPAGLVRFDGLRFDLFDRWNTPVLEESSILSLYEDSEGILWIGTDGGGLCSYDRGEWYFLREPEGLPDRHVRSLAGGRDGLLWAGTEFGLCGFNRGVAKAYGLDQGLADDIVNSLVIDPFGRLWAGTMWGGLARFENGLVQIYDNDDGLGDVRVLSLFADRDGKIWIGTMKGLYSLGPGGKKIDAVDRMADLPVTAIDSGPNGGLLVGTMVEGLKLIDGGVVMPFSLGDETESCHIHSLLTDRRGNTWIGTESKGLFRAMTRQVGSITAAEGLPEGPITALYEDSKGSLWMGTGSGGLCRLSGGIVEGRCRFQDRLAGRMVRALAEDRSGRMWIGTIDGGLSVVDGEDIENIKIGDDPASSRVTAILHARDGMAWIGTEGGLYSGTVKMDRFEGVDSLEGRMIRTIHETRSGDLYAGTRGGLWRLTGSVWERVSPGGGEDGPDVISMYDEAGGGIWIGTNGSGLLYISDRGMISFSTEDGIPGNFICSITEGEAGFLWIGCEVGVFHVSRDSLLTFGRGGPEILAPRWYDDREGMPSRRCSGLCNPSVCRSETGLLYFPTAAGVAVFGGETAQMKAVVPRVLIESITVDGICLDRDEDISIPHGTGLVEIRFTAFDYSAPEKIRFLFSLDGYDSAPVALHPGRERTAVYNNLPPGEYGFTVRAISNAGAWSSAAILPFSVEGPFYTGIRFFLTLLAVISASGGLAAGVVKRRKILKRKMKYSTSTISGERMDEALEGLRILVEEEKVFLDPDLTLKKLARRLNIHYNHLSRIINENYNVSFNNYINRFRVEEAIEKLADPEMRDKNILEIMYESGFYSKSTFNTAFKKTAGCSPSAYRKRHLG